METLTIQEAFKTCKTKNITINYLVYGSDCACCGGVYEVRQRQHSYEGPNDSEAYKHLSKETFSVFSKNEKVEKINEGEYNYHTFDWLAKLGMQSTVCKECYKIIKELDLKYPDYHAINEDTTDYNYTCIRNYIIEARKENKLKHVINFSQKYFEQIISTKEDLEPRYIKTTKKELEPTSRHKVYERLYSWLLDADVLNEEKFNDLRDLEKAVKDAIADALKNYLVVRGDVLE